MGADLGNYLRGHRRKPISPRPLYPKPERSNSYHPQRQEKTCLLRLYALLSINRSAPRDILFYSSTPAKAAAEDARTMPVFGPIEAGFGKHDRWAARHFPAACMTHTSSREEKGGLPRRIFHARCAPLGSSGSNRRPPIEPELLYGVELHQPHPRLTAIARDDQGI